MEIFSKPPLPMPLLTIARQTDSVDLSFLKPGQRLSAQVVSSSTNGMVSIKINDQLLKVMSDMQLMPGAKIEVKVELKNGQLMLRLITQQDNALDTPQQALRQVLPKQQAMQPLFAQLARIVTQLKGLDTLILPGREASTTVQAALSPARAVNLDTLPPEIRQAIESLLKQLPNNEKLSTPDGLKQAINNSGMFFESKLHHGGAKANLSADLKTILFRISFLLRQSLETLPSLPPLSRPLVTSSGKVSSSPSAHRSYTGTQATEAGSKQLETTSLLQLLTRLSESTLARVQMNQLTALSSQQQGEETAITLEIPLFNGKESEVLEVKIRRDSKRDNGEGETCWSVTLKLDSENHGALRAVVSLLGQQVSTTFWCEQPETQQLFHQHLEELRERMLKQGLEAGQTQAFTGMQPEPDTSDRPLPNDNLINTKA